MKVLQRTESLSIIATVFKVNDQDYMVVGEDGIIEGVGYRFAKILGRVHNLPLRLISDCNFKRMVRSQSVRAKKHIFSSTRQCQEEVTELRQSYEQGENWWAHEEALKERLEESPKFEIEFDAHCEHVGKTTLVVMKIREYGEFTITLTERHMQESEGLIRPIEGRVQESFIDSEDVMEEDDPLIHCANNSVSSTQKHEDFSFTKSINKLEAIFFHPSRVQSRPLTTLLALMVVCSISMVLFLSVVLYYTQKGMTEIQELFFADGACSDNMQLLEFMYNKGMNLEIYSDKPEFESIRMSADYETYYVYGLIAAEAVSLTNTHTKFTHTPYYVYNLEVSQWIDFSGVARNVTTTEFMSRLVYCQVAVMSYAGQGKHEMILEMLKLVQANFPQMKANNHKFLQLYMDLFL